MSRRSNTTVDDGPFPIPLSGRSVARFRTEKAEDHGQAAQIHIANAGSMRQFEVDAATGKAAAVPSDIWSGFTERTLRQRRAI